VHLEFWFCHYLFLLPSDHYRRRRDFHGFTMLTLTVGVLQGSGCFWSCQRPCGYGTDVYHYTKFLVVKDFHHAEFCYISM
jgi:hypothetical protein